MNRRRLLGRTRGREISRGQSLVEYAVTIPVFLMIVLGMLEFGFAFAHNLTLEYGTREGARVGSALANGTDVFPCAGGLSSPVDAAIIAAVQRVLTSPGSQVDLNRIGEIHIYQATAGGTESGTAVNRWVLGSGPPAYQGGPNLLFKPIGNLGWDACTRKNASNPDSIGVSLTYDYKYVTPLGSVLGFAGSPTMKMSDRTVMALNPS